MSGAGSGQPDAGALAAAIEAGLAGAGIPALSAGTQRLMTAYRCGGALTAPVLATRADAAAYAAYRMPATAAAVALALAETRLSLPGWRPESLLDFGAGTGSAAWAVAAELPSVGVLTLLEQSTAAIAAGRAILGAAALPALRAATWRTWRLPGGRPDPGRRDDLPAADLATVSYVLGELTPTQQAAIVALAIRAAPAVVLVEPGTPDGHHRILAARERLLAAGYLLAAPCPHRLACPLAAAGDWCHFAARLPRSAVHRRAKGAELGYEDEKFSYVAAVRPDPLGPEPASPVLPAGRIVRRPQQRKGLVTLEVCWRDGTAGPDRIGKSTGAAYRAARKSFWGARFDHPPLAGTGADGQDEEP
ncbi:MAG TPA: small ribosomal subunit Rsm22 family protein [Streptosporangiaceae bacterium]|nr:small ribosomal subunit Rsm22 family protein [Streptosporangiaceae bacterium]